MKIKVEKGLPIPKSGSGGHNAKYPWDSMEIGDSFLVPYRPNVPNAHTQTNLLCCANGHAKKNNLPNKYRTRCCPDGVRIWRIK